MRSKFSKYKFDYSPSDYQYNLRYKWMSRNTRSKSASNGKSFDNLYFIEMLISPDLTNQKTQLILLQVQQLSPELCAKIDQAKLEGQDKVFVRTSILHGHYINLDNMTLVNTQNMSKRRIYSLRTLPEGAIIYHPLTQTAMRLTDSPTPMKQFGSFPLDRNVNIQSFSAQHKLRHQDQLVSSKLQQLGQQDVQQEQHHENFHWMESLGGHNSKYKPLKRSLSDVIERNYLLYSGKLCNSICEILWQEKRFILDLKENTLQNSKTLVVSILSRVNLKDVRDMKQYLLERADYQSDQNPQIFNQKDYEWQFEFCNFGKRGIEWQSYDLRTQKKLERKYQEYIKMGDNRLKHNFKVKRGTQTYYIDYQKKIEYNTIHRTERQIQRISLNDEFIDQTY